MNSIGFAATGGSDSARRSGRRVAWPDADSRGEQLVSLMARERGIPAALILARTRCPRKVSTARAETMYLMHVALGWNLARVGRAVGRDRTTVSHACELIEDRRDDLYFDAEMIRLERLIEGFGPEVPAAAGACL